MVDRQYKKLVQSTEYATRMGEYQLAKAAGFSDMGASFQVEKLQLILE